MNTTHYSYLTRGSIMKQHIITVLLFAVVSMCGSLHAQIPGKISYQGYIVNAAGQPENGTVSMDVRLYDAETGGTQLWSEPHSATVKNGVFSIILGDRLALDHLAYDKPYWLEVAVNEQIMTPRTMLTSVPYALNSRMAKALAPGATGVVTKLNGADGEILLRGDGGTTVNRNGQTITITLADTGRTGILRVLNNDGTIAVENGNGPYTTINVAANAINTDHLADGAVTAGKLVNDAVTTGKIVNEAVTSAKLADDAVTSGKLANDAVTTGKMVNEAVTTAKLDDNAVTSGKLANDAVTTGKIVNEAVTSAKLADDAVTSGKLANDAVTTGKMVNEAVTSAKLADDAVTSGKLANDAVTTSKIDRTNAAAGNVLMYDGSQVVWADPPAFTLPLNVKASLSEPVVSVVNTITDPNAGGVAISAYSNIGAAIFAGTSLGSSSIFAYTHNPGTSSAVAGTHAVNENFGDLGLNSCGVRAVSQKNYPAIIAEAKNPTGHHASGIKVSNSSSVAPAVDAVNTSTTGTGANGVRSMSYSGDGVYARSNGDNRHGIFGIVGASQGTGVKGVHEISQNEGALGNQSFGVRGRAYDGGVAVLADNYRTTGSTAHALHAVCRSPDAYAVVATNSDGRALIAQNESASKPTIIGKNTSTSSTAPILQLEDGTSLVFSVRRDGLVGARFLSADYIDAIASTRAGIRGITSHSGSPGVFAAAFGGTGGIAFAAGARGVPPAPQQDYYNFVIKTDGGTGIGTTNPAYKLHVVGDAGKTVGGTTWVNASDHRLKNIFGEYTPGLRELLGLRPIRFEYKPGNVRDLPSGSEEIGFIAQEVREIFPECVTEGKDGYLDFNMHAINVALVNAVQELESSLRRVGEENESLKTELSALRMEQSSMYSEMMRLREEFARFAAESKQDSSGHEIRFVAE
jgi:hypothetical protein